MKNKNWLLGVKIFMLCLFMSLPVFVFAQGNDPVSQGLGAVQQSGGFQNQSGTILGARNVVELIGTIIKLMLFVAGAIAVLFVIIGGFIYLTAHGNDEQATKGRKTVTQALVGIIIIILSYVIVNVGVNLVNCGTSGGIGGC